MRKTILILAILIFASGSVAATEFTGTVDVPQLGLFGTLTSDADTTFTVNFNNGSQSGIAVFTQAVMDASSTTPSLATGTLTGGGTTTFSLTVDTIVTTSSAWTGYISYSDSETTGPLTIAATPAAETPPDFSVSTTLSGSRNGSLQLFRMVWETNDAGKTSASLSVPLGLIRSVRFFNTIAPAEDYDITFKDASGFDAFVSLGADLTSVSTTTKNPVLNTSWPVAVFGAYTLEVTNAGQDRSGVVEVMIGD